MVFFAINLFDGRLLGFGDVRLAPVLGLLTRVARGRLRLPGFLRRQPIGAVTGVGLISIKRKSRQARIPYGVFARARCGLAVPPAPNASALYQLPRLTISGPSRLRRRIAEGRATTRPLKPSTWSPRQEWSRKLTPSPSPNEFRHPTTTEGR